jgi:hypothetical protein
MRLPGSPESNRRIVSYLIRLSSPSFPVPSAGKKKTSSGIDTTKVEAAKALPRTRAPTDSVDAALDEV